MGWKKEGYGWMCAHIERPVDVDAGISEVPVHLSTCEVGYVSAQVRRRHWEKADLVMLYSPASKTVVPPCPHSAIAFSICAYIV